MDTAHLTLADVAEDPPEGVVVVIDVLRAFTVAPLALAWGGAEVRCVATVEQARRLGATDGRVLVGEARNGRDVEGFDANNSPTQIRELDLDGRTIVHRTTHGTQGLALTVPSAGVVLAASFANAAATAAALRTLDPPRVGFVITGAKTHSGEEDLALAEYVTALLGGGAVDAQPYVDRVAASDTGQRFVGPDAEFAETDLRWAMTLDAVDFALLARSAVEDGVDHVVLRPIREPFEELRGR